jgi:hypothetical protein
MIFFLLLLAVLVVFAIALYCSQLAVDKGRQPIVWFVIGLLFGPLALIAASRLPPKEEMNPPKTARILSIRRHQPPARSAEQDAPDRLDERR